MRATAVLKEKGISAQHMHVSTLKPFTDPTIVEAIKKSKYGVVTIKTIWISAVSAPAVADVIAENGLGKRLVKIGLPGYPHGASQMYLMKKYGIDAMHLVSAVEDLTGKKLGGLPARSGSLPARDTRLRLRRIPQRFHLSHPAAWWKRQES